MPKDVKPELFSQEIVRICMENIDLAFTIFLNEARFSKKKIK